MGSTIQAHNSDEVLHTVHAYFAASFNLALPRKGAKLERVVKEPGIIQVRCDMHGWMNAYIGVLDHPYFAVSGSDGSFSLDGLPPGDYVIEAWHELYGTLTQNVTVGEKESAGITFLFSESMAGSDVPLGEPLVLGSHEAESDGHVHGGADRS